MTVTVRVDTVGTVRIGPPPEVWPFHAPMGLAGGTVVIDPFAPDAPPYAELDGPAEAADWLEAVYGPGTRAVVRATVAAARAGSVAAHDRVDATVRSAAVPWSPGPGHESLVRLAMTRWLGDWSPDGLDPVLLDLEAGGLLWDLDGVVPGAVALARKCLTRSADPLLELAERLRHWTPEQVSDGLVAEAVLDSVLAAACLLEGHRHHPRLLALAREEASVRASGARLSGPESRVPALARVETAAQDSAEGTSSVDWEQVPARVLDAADNTVRWRTVRGTADGDLLQVTVRAAPRAVRVEGLGFRAYHPRLPLPVALGRLHRPAEPGDPTLRGEAVLSPLMRALDAAGLVVDVFDAAMVSPPRTGRAALRAVRRRRAVRQLTSLRRRWATRDAAGMSRWVPAAARTAGDLDESAARRGPDPLATRMWNLVSAAAVTARSLGAPDVPVPERAEGRERAGDPAGPPRVPWLRDPTWRPTVAEWLAVRPDFGLTAR
ncbi:hypothetical protein [Streptomyces ziwulingensis]|uniref:Uncharacterized protein n=1 Tax=Streptomyces ziwulingensis TaxID=1045501 RepID=A0ABP9CSA2_9ACTN